MELYFWNTDFVISERTLAILSLGHGKDNFMKLLISILRNTYIGLLSILKSLCYKIEKMKQYISMSRLLVQGQN